MTKPSTPDSNRSTVLGGTAEGWAPWPYQWLCPQESRKKLACSKKLLQSGNNWTFPNYSGPKVEYCLSKKMDKKCRLEYGILVAGLTVGAIGLKLLCFIATYLVLKRGSRGTDDCGAQSHRKMQPLMTTGDAIASFLEFEDNTTVGISTVEKRDFENDIWDHRWVRINPMPWRERRPCSQFRAIAVRRWLIGMTMYVVCRILHSVRSGSNIIIQIVCYSTFPFWFLLSRYRWFKDDLALDIGAIRDLGLGNPTGLFLFGVWNGDIQTDRSVPLNTVPSSWQTLRNIVVSNTPQLALVFAYYIWNSHVTVMIAAREYTMYAASTKSVDGTEYHQPRHSLRVTDARKGTEQRNSHFFEIPILYWIPITAL